MSTRSTRPPDPDCSVSPVMLSVERMMMAAQVQAMAVQAMAAQTVLPLNKFTGEDVYCEDSSFESQSNGME